MIPEIHYLLKKFYTKKSQNTKKMKLKKSSGKNKKVFEEYFKEVTVEKILDEFKDYEPEQLIDKIVEIGKRYNNHRKEEDLNEYKYYLSGFIALGVNHGYKLYFMKKKGLNLEDYEKKYSLILEVQKKFVVLTDTVLNSQMDIISNIKEIEGILVNIKI